MARTPAARAGQKKTGRTKTGGGKADTRKADTKKSAKRKTASRPAGPKVSIARRGLMLVLSSPSGAGKTTLSRMLLDHDRSVELSVSVTTRTRRTNEKDGRDYHFIDKARFTHMVDAGELLEWAEVFGNLYGTPRAPVEASLAAGRDVLFDIDWQGTQQLRE
jgi:guanylate kinase